MNLSKHTVFAAYARVDTETVHAIIGKLKARGVKIWVDTFDIRIGANWSDTIENAIRSADTVLFFISEASMVSEFCKAEVRWAIDAGKRILPVVIDQVRNEVIPFDLAKYQYLIYRDPEDETALAALESSLKAGAEYGPSHQGNKIFISYRRRSDSHVAGRLFDHLEAEFGEDSIFFDVERIPLGVDFRTYIRTSLMECSAITVIIGHTWIGSFKKQGLFLSRVDEDSEDHVRTEIETAFDHNVRIIPLLVDGATMPRRGEVPKSISQICYLNAGSLRAGKDFRTDVRRVIDDVRKPPQTALVA